VTFYVSRSLDSGPIRFGVGHRLVDPTADDPGRGQFSTGARGEYLRLRQSGQFYSDALGTSSPGALVFQSSSRRPEPLVPWWGWVSIGFGGLLILLGILVVVNKGYASGYVEAVVGVALIVLPFVLTYEKRRRERVQREKQRLEREAYEKEIRRSAGEYLDRLNRLDSAPDEAALVDIRRAREGKEIPYEHVSSAARAAVLRAGFDALSRWDELGGKGIAQAVARTAEAVGLAEEDRLAVRRVLLHRTWWHLLADDRMGPESGGKLEELRDALGIPPEEVTRERRTSDEFEKLRGIGPKTLPKVDPTFRLRALETCLHVTRGKILTPRINIPGMRSGEGGKWKEGEEQEIVVTTQRVLVRRGKDLELDVREIWDLETDVDDGILLLVEGGEKRKNHYLALSDPVYTAGVIQAAAEAPLKPKGLV
jgi:hypothetical protein